MSRADCLLVTQKQDKALAGRPGMLERELWCCQVNPSDLARGGGCVEPGDEWKCLYALSEGVAFRWWDVFIHSQPSRLPEQLLALMGDKKKNNLIPVEDQTHLEYLFMARGDPDQTFQGNHFQSALNLQPFSKKLQKVCKQLNGAVR